MAGTYRNGGFSAWQLEKGMGGYTLLDDDLVLGSGMLANFSYTPIQKFGLLSSWVLDFLVFCRAVSILRKQSFSAPGLNILMFHCHRSGLTYSFYQSHMKGDSLRVYFGLSSAATKSVIVQRERLTSEG